MALTVGTSLFTSTIAATLGSWAGLVYCNGTSFQILTVHFIDCRLTSEDSGRFAANRYFFVFFRTKVRLNSNEILNFTSILLEQYIINNDNDLDGCNSGR